MLMDDENWGSKISNPHPDQYGVVVNDSEGNEISHIEEEDSEQV